MPVIETDLVPRIMLEEREQELLAKDELCQVSAPHPRSASGEART